MRRGEVWWIDLAPRSGSEQRGRRPAVIVSHDSLNTVEAWRSIIVVPVTTSTRQARLGPTVVPIPSGEGGLPRESMALCHQVTTLGRTKFVERTGTLSDDTFHALDAGLNVALDLRP